MTKISSTWQERSWEAKSISDNKEIFLLFLLHSFILSSLLLICETENLFAFFLHLTFGLLSEPDAMGQKPEILFVFEDIIQCHIIRTALSKDFSYQDSKL